MRAAGTNSRSSSEPKDCPLVVVRPRCGVDGSVVRRVSEGAVSVRPGRGVSVALGSAAVWPQAEIVPKEIITVANSTRLGFVIRRAFIWKNLGESPRVGFDVRLRLLS